MKVAELIGDLETGDRTMEHLKNGWSKPVSPEAFRREIEDISNRLSASSTGFLSGLTGNGLGSMIGPNAFGQQQNMNQFLNQQMNSLRGW